MSYKGPCQLCLGDRHLIVWRSGERESRPVVIQCPECNPEAYRAALLSVCLSGICAPLWHPSETMNPKSEAERIVAEYLAEKERL